jgi:hypothetical protein
MKPNLTCITLGVRDFSRALAFYKDALGWPTEANPTDPVAFFELPGLILSIFSWENLAKDAGVAPEGSGFRGCTLAYNVGSKVEADEAMEEWTKAGATVVKPMEDTFWGGYGGYVTDPEGHLWEIVWNPFWKMTDDGRARLS